MSKFCLDLIKTLKQTRVDVVKELGLGPPENGRLEMRYVTEGITLRKSRTSSPVSHQTAWRLSMV